jgi:uncharacterized protein YggE
MRYTTAVLAALFCICGAVVVVTALTPTPTVGNTTAGQLIRTSAVGEIVSSPDRAEIQVGVETENADVQVAQSQNAERMTNVTNAMKALGIPEDHLTTTGYTVTPVYDTGPNSAELLAEHAAINGVSRVLIGSSRRGTIHHLIKGSFQRKLENLLPPDIPVQVVLPPEVA